MAEAPHSLDQPVRCHHCQHPLESPIGCLHCHAIFPPASDLSHFDRLGLPKRYEVDPRELDRKYLAWSRELHPDYFQTKSATEQSASLSLSASLNDAYATLKDPFRRAEYLLHLLGGPTASENREMPGGFLEHVLELRMEIEERSEDCAGNEEGAASLRRRIEAERRQAMSAAAARFAEIEANADGPDPVQLSSIRESLNTVKYYDGLLRELESGRGDPSGH